MKKTISAILLFAVATLLFAQCQQSEASEKNPHEVTYGQFKDKVEWGKHLVTVSACHDCHSPKNLDGGGLELDSSRLLSGHRPGDPVPEVNWKEIKEKGSVVTVGGLTSWAGPWGVSYAANLTSDETGIGNWSEEQFMTALRKGKFKGLEGSRDLLPPMPWEMYRNFTDDEIKAIFAYLKSTKPVENVVPAAKAPGDL